MTMTREVTRKESDAVPARAGIAGTSGTVNEEVKRMTRDASMGVRATVLVVDDSDELRELMTTYLVKAGCVVVAVQNAEDAIAAYLLETPDMAIVDLLLPGMNGWEFVGRLRSDRPSCAIVVTSVLDAADFPPSEARLPKPFTRAQILKVLDDCVPE
jgi:CheY-like chemotaxis protein